MSKQAPQNKTPMSESQFQMWRCVIAIAHADGQMHDEERRHLHRIFGNLDRVHGLTADQRQTLDGDMAAPKDVADILPLIVEPQYRGTLIYFGEALAWADNELSLDEELILKKLHADHMATVDIGKLRADIRQQLTRDKAQHEKDIQQIHAGGGGRSPVLRALGSVLGRLGLDLLA